MDLSANLTAGIGDGVYVYVEPAVEEVFDLGGQGGVIAFEEVPCGKYRSGGGIYEYVAVEVVVDADESEYDGAVDAGGGTVDVKAGDVVQRVVRCLGTVEIKGKEGQVDGQAVLGGVEGQ